MFYARTYRYDSRQVYEHHPLQAGSLDRHGDHLRGHCATAAHTVAHPQLHLPATTHTIRLISETTVGILIRFSQIDRLIHEESVGVLNMEFRSWAITVLMNQVGKKKITVHLRKYFSIVFVWASSHTQALNLVKLMKHPLYWYRFITRNMSNVYFVSPESTGQHPIF